MTCILQKLPTEYEKKTVCTQVLEILFHVVFKRTVSLETLGLLSEFVMKQERQLPLLWLYWSDLSTFNTLSCFVTKVH
jgi:hypothetical protein